MDLLSDNKRIERVVLACVQCRGRHVKCGSEQPRCNRCKRDGKGCVYQKSRRGGLDKAALERRRLRLLREAEDARKVRMGEEDEGERRGGEGRSSTEDQEGRSSTEDQEGRSSTEDQEGRSSTEDQEALDIDTGCSATDEKRRGKEGNQLAFHMDGERLLELFFENFWPSSPVVLPLLYLQARRLDGNYGLEKLIPVLHWIGSLYTPWTPSEPYYDVAAEVMNEASLGHTPFNVQALMLFALAQYHSDIRVEARKTLDTAIAMALELRMNEQHFAQLYGEGDPVLEESWRRTYYILYIVDQHFAIVSNTPFYTLLTVPNNVDLPCDDEDYACGIIPTPVTWAEYENREFEEQGGEKVYGSIVYLYDMAMIVAYIMTSFFGTGLMSESMVEIVDAKLAAWASLLPAGKIDPLRQNGLVDEVIFTAHSIHAIVLSTLHRPFSSLAYTPGELVTTSFSPPSPFVLPSRAGRMAHTARTLKATEMLTRLLAIPCSLERHSVFSMCITAQLVAVQISACRYLLDGHAASTARDRMRLGIGFLSAMGSVWGVGKKITGEVREIARASLERSSIPHAVIMDAETEMGKLGDDVVWPVDPSAQIDTYSGVVMPIDWERMAFR